MGKQNIFSNFFLLKVESIDARKQIDNGWVSFFKFCAFLYIDKPKLFRYLNVNGGINQCILNGSPFHSFENVDEIKGRK